MRKISFVALSLLVATHGSFAETLVAPPFPESAAWVHVPEVPMKAANDQVAAVVRTAYLATDTKERPENLMSVVTIFKRSPNVGAAEHLALMVHGMRLNCESVQATRAQTTLERGVPVAYARFYCPKAKEAGFGIIQTVKVLQGRGMLFSVTREWRVPVFELGSMPATGLEFAQTIFKNADDAARWIKQLESANNHLANRVTLCANSDEEFGETCTKK